SDRACQRKAQKRRKTTRREQHIRLYKISRRRRPSSHCPAVGNTQRDRPEYRRVRLENYLWRVSRIIGKGNSTHRLGELWRTCCHSERTALYRRNEGPEIQSLQEGNR